MQTNTTASNQASKQVSSFTHTTHTKRACTQTHALTQVKWWIECVYVSMRVSSKDSLHINTAYAFFAIGSCMPCMCVCVHTASHTKFVMYVLKRKDTCSYVFHFSSRNFSQRPIHRTQYVLAHKHTYNGLIMCNTYAEQSNRRNNQPNHHDLVERVLSKMEKNRFVTYFPLLKIQYWLFGLGPIHSHSLVLEAHTHTHTDSDTHVQRKHTLFYAYAYVYLQ